MAVDKGYRSKERQAPDVPEWVRKEVKIDPARYKLYRLADLYQLEPAKYILDPFVPEACVVLLYGYTGSCKTFIALDWCFRIAQEHEVMYFYQEGFRGLPLRLNAWEQYFNLTPTHFIASSRGPSIFDQEEVRGWIAFINREKVKPKVIVFDTLSTSMYGAEENSNTDMAKVMLNARLLMEELGSTVIIVHHEGKEKDKGPRGASALPSNADTIIRISSAGQKTKVVNVENEINRDTELFPKTSYKMEQAYNSLVAIQDDEFKKIKTAKQMEAEEDRNARVNAIWKWCNEAGQISYGDLYEKFRTMFQLSESTFKKVLKQAEKDKMVYKNMNQGGIWQVHERYDQGNNNIPF